MLAVKATLRIFSENYSLAQLENFIGVPTRGFSKGDSYSHGKKIREKTFWSFESQVPSSEKFESHLVDIISFLEKHKSTFSIIENDCEIDLFCMLSSNNGQGGFVLPYQLVDEISKYHLNIVFDVYAD